MTTDREYPETAAGPFPEPPTTVDDHEGRTIHIDRCREDHLPRLVRMYTEFDPSQRAQGIPPGDPDRIEPWLRDVLGTGTHVIATYRDAVVGHAMLVPDEGNAHELAIFVNQDFQGAGIGTALVQHLLGAGKADCINRVWLTVERWNAPAIALYRTVGFETVRADRFDLEMALSIPERMDVSA